jgi:hypothetical protein
VAALGNISELGSDLDRNCFVYPQLTSQRRLVLRIVRLAETKDSYYERRKRGELSKLY